MDSILERKIDDFVEQNIDDIIKDIAELCRIESVRTAAEPGAPFGKNCAKALRAALKKAEDMCFDSEGHIESGYGVVSMGSGAKTVAFLGHTDVVPAGSGWTMCEPFEPQVHDGILYGRGVKDDKCGVIAGYYVMKAVRELGEPFSSRLITVVGGAEETGMEDMDNYSREQPAPDVCLVIDGDFPACFGEKDIVNCTFTADRAFEQIVSLSAGSVVNAVPASACAVITNGDGLERQLRELCAEESRLELEGSGDKLTLRASGLSAHGSHPERGINALGILVSALVKCTALSGHDRDILLPVADSLADCFGEKLGIAHTDPKMGRSTVLCSIAGTEDGVLSVKFDMRVGCNVTGQLMMSELCRVMESHGMKTDATRLSRGYFIDPDGDIITPIMDIYRNVTGEKDAQAYTMGGGTYARRVKNAFVFGPAFLNHPIPLPDGHGRIHQPDECLEIDDFKQAMKMYIRAAYEIDKKIN